MGQNRKNTGIIKTKIKLFYFFKRVPFLGHGISYAICVGDEFAVNDDVCVRNYGFRYNRVNPEKCAFTRKKRAYISLTIKKVQVAKNNILL